MNEREFIKVNTSIQTGSNVNDLKYDADGNIEARIALRLPANLFDNNAGTRKIDKVTMATSKMRLSLENTPIASLPVESETVKNNTLVLKPQLDVYPFSLTGEKLLVPTSLNDSSFPLYKSHEVLFRIQVVTVLEPLSYVSGGQLQYFPNSPDVYQNTSSLLYPILEKTGVLEQVNHKLNLMMQNNHEPFKMENGHVLIKSLSSLCQIFQDALENAITYASTNDNRVIDVFFVDSTLNVDSLSPNIDKRETYEINGTSTYYWKTENVSATGGSNLNFACKPLVRFNSQSFSISLDTCVFKDIVPIVWNTAFITTFERPQQLIQDLLRQNYWIQPPPKRVYKYGLHQVADESYSYYLLQTLTCRVMNIIGDKIMRDCFSFLPWVEVPQSLVLGGNSFLKSFNVKTETTPYTVDVTYKKCVYNTNISTRGVVIQGPYFADSTGDHRYFQVYRMSFYRMEDERLDLYKHFGIIAGTILYNTEDNKPHYSRTLPTWPPASGSPIIISPPNGPSRKIYESNPTPGETTVTEEESFDQSLVPGQTQNTTRGPLEHLNDETKEITDADPEFEGHLHANFYWYANPTQKYIPSTTVVGQWLSDENNKPLCYLPLPYFSATFRPNYGDDTIKFEYTDEYITQEEFLRRRGNSTDDPYYDVLYPEDLTSWAYCRIDTWTMPREFPLGNNPATFVHNPSATPCIVSDYAARNPPPTVTNAHIELSYNQRVITETTTTITETSNPPIITNTDITPNLKQDSRDSFYVLDGTTCDITIGPQEPILTGERLERWKITTTTSYQQIDTTTTKTWKSGSGDDLVDINVTEYTIEGSYQDFTHVGHLHTEIFQIKDTNPNHSAYTLVINDDQDRIYQPKEITSGQYLYVMKPSDTTLQATQIDESTHSGEVDPPPTTVEITYSSDPSLTPGTTTTTSETTTHTVGEYYPQDTIFQTTKQWLKSTDSNGLYGEWLDMSSNDTSNGEYEPFWVSHSTAGGGVAYSSEYYPTSGTYNLYDIPDLSMANKFWHPKSTDAATSWMTWPTAEGSFQARSWVIKIAAPRDIEQPTAHWTYIPCIRSYQYKRVKQDTVDSRLIATTTTVIEPILHEYEANLRLTYTWDNLPMVVLSPIQSIVLILDGMNVNQEFLPVNITEQTGSSLVSSVAVIENFYSLATTLRDLHDELIVIKDSFNDMATYNVDDSSGKERTLTLTAKYITKDGSIHSIYIPPNGVFTVQLTFRLDFFTSSSTY